MFDVYPLLEMGYENVCAVMTSNLQQRQYQTLKRLNRPVYLMFDWDSAGAKGRANAFKKYSKGIVFYDVPGVDRCEICGERWSKIVDVKGKPIHKCSNCGAPWVCRKKDPGCLSKDELLDCLKNARSSFFST